MGGGGAQATTTEASYDPAQLAAFIQTGEGKQYASSYSPLNSYANVGGAIYAYNPATLNNGSGAPLSVYGTGVGGGEYSFGPNSNVTAMINAFNTWSSGQQQSQLNWQNYANAVNANEGGEGDNTITTGPAQSQRNQLLGALAGAGAPGNPNSAPASATPASGLGSMGATTKTPGAPALGQQVGGGKS